MIKPSLSFTEEKIRALKVGDEVLISGVLVTGREMRKRVSQAYRQVLEIRESCTIHPANQGKVGFTFF